MAIAPAAKKSNEYEQLARTSETTGNRAFQQSPDTGSAPLVDEHGRLITRIAGAGGFVPVVTGTTTQVPSGARSVVDQIVVSAVPCTVQDLVFYHRSATPQFFQIHDASALLSGGETPVYQIEVGVQPVLLSYSVETPLSTGMVIAVSTTEDTFTAGTITMSLTGNFVV